MGKRAPIYRAGKAVDLCTVLCAVYHSTARGCSQDLRSMTCPGHGHATCDIRQMLYVVCCMSTCLASNKYRVGSDVKTKQN
jgi:hypothetical protein